jgi:sugar-specific transcriptional regulator TrmB
MMKDPKEAVPLEQHMLGVCLEYIQERLDKQDEAFEKQKKENQKIWNHLIKLTQQHSQYPSMVMDTIQKSEKLTNLIVDTCKDFFVDHGLTKIE